MLSKHKISVAQLHMMVFQAQFGTNKLRSGFLTSRINLGTGLLRFWFDSYAYKMQLKRN